MTGALLAKRGERDILREARDQRKIPRSHRLSHNAPVMQGI